VTTVQHIYTCDYRVAGFYRAQSHSLCCTELQSTALEKMLKHVWLWQQAV